MIASATIDRLSSGAPGRLPQCVERDEGLDVDAGRHAHAREHPGRILRRDVAGRAWGEGTAAQSAERRVEHAHAARIGRPNIRQPEAVGAVRVKRPLSTRKSVHASAEQALDVGGVGAAGGAAQAEFGVAPQRREAIEESDHGENVVCCAIRDMSDPGAALAVEYDGHIPRNFDLLFETEVTRQVIQGVWSTDKKMALRACVTVWKSDSRLGVKSC